MSLNLGDTNCRNVIGWQFIVWRRQDDVSDGHDYCIDGQRQSGVS
jgi:hypothetical protein